jgi:DNA-binding SARP family transcriptional activator/streptogramin lyase
MEFRVLGPIEVREGEHPLPLGGGRQRSLLVALLLRRNEVVSTERLLDELWDGRPPETAATALHGLVSQLRKALEPGRDTRDPPRALVTRAPGYVLHVDEQQLDSARFERLLGDAHRALAADDAGAAAELLRQALALWRGPAFAEVADRQFAQVEAHRLDELRLQALEDRIEADLLLGHGERVVPELETLVAREPLRERARALLMRALYASGRQADALAVYQDGRRLLVDELGIEPGPRLQELERAILRQDPSLGHVAEPVRPVRKPMVPARRSRLVVAAVLALAAAAAALAGVFAFDRGGATALAGVDADHVGIVDPESNSVVGEIAVGSRPAAVAVGDGSIWVANAEDGTVMRIDPKARRVVQTIGIGAPASSLAVSRDAVWVGNGSAGTVSRIDPRSNAVIQTIDLRGSNPVVPNGIQSLAVGAGGVWVAVGLHAVARLDPASGRIVRRIDVGSPPQAVAVGEDAVWAATGGERVVRIEPDSNRASAFQQIRYPVGVTTGFGRVWVVDGQLTVFDAQSLNPDGGVPSGEYPIAAATAFGSVWSIDHDGGYLYRTAPDDYQRQTKIHLGNTPADVAAGEGEVWVCVQQP